MENEAPLGSHWAANGNESWPGVNEMQPIGSSGGGGGRGGGWGLGKHLCVTRPASDHHRNTTNTQEKRAAPPWWHRRGLYPQQPSGSAKTEPASHITGVRQPERRQQGLANGRPVLDTHYLSTRLALERDRGGWRGGYREQVERKPDCCAATTLPR